MPLAVVPLFALTSLLSTTPAPQHLFISTSHPAQQFPVSFPSNSSLLQALALETHSKAFGKETTSKPTESPVSGEPLSAPSRLAALISALPSLSNDAPDDRRTLFPATASPVIVHGTTNHSELTAVEKEDASDLDTIDEQPVIRRASPGEDGQRMKSFRPRSLPNFPTPLSIAEFLNRFTAATEAPVAGVMSIREGTSPRPSGRKHSASESTSEDGAGTPTKSIFNVLFGDAASPGAVSFFPNAFTSITPKRPPAAAPRPLSAFSDMLARWRNLDQTSTSTSTEKSATKSLNSSRKNDSSAEQSLSQDSDSVKNYFLNLTMPFLLRLYTDSRNSSLEVPVQDRHAYNSFGLDSDDLANSFLYQFFKNVFSKGLAGVDRASSLSDDLIALTQRLLNPVNVMNIIFPFHHGTDGRSGYDNKQSSNIHNQIHVHDAFESDFDSMSEERWFQTPEFVVSVSVVSVFILLVLISLTVRWSNTRKSNSFPVSLHQMNYEEAPKSQILYI